MLPPVLPAHLFPGRGHICRKQVLSKPWLSERGWCEQVRKREAKAMALSCHRLVGLITKSWSYRNWDAGMALFTLFSRQILKARRQVAMGRGTG